MKTIDSRIQYYELIMLYKNTNHYSEYVLPEGYHFEFFKPGDELAWVNIHIKSGEFTSVQQGLEWFHQFFDGFADELSQRCFFIVHNETGEKVATATLSRLDTPEHGCYAAVDWLAIQKEFQGKHLAKPLISQVLYVAKKLHHQNIVLHTQTTTWLAVKLYLDFGFEIVNTEEKIGWGIIKTLTNHKTLHMYNAVPMQEIYDERNTQIEHFLCEKFGSTNFNYTVWYKNNMNKVYAYFQGQTYEFSYEEKDNKVIIKEEKNKTYQM